MADPHRRYLSKLEYRLLETLIGDYGIAAVMLALADAGDLVVGANRPSDAQRAALIHCYDALSAERTD